MPKGIYHHKPISEEHKKKISQANRGRPSGMLGKKHSEETRKKMSLAKKGMMPRNFYEIQKKGWEMMRGKPAWNRGTKSSRETIEKMRLAKIGKPRGGNPENWKHTEETKKKLSEKLKGKTAWNKNFKMDEKKYPKWGNYKDGLWKKDKLVVIRSRRQSKQESLAGRPKPNQCEICGLGGKICFDHCHKTGKFRGWICSRCNLILGQIEDSKDILIKLLNYLQKNK